MIFVTHVHSSLSIVRVCSGYYFVCKCFLINVGEFNTSCSSGEVGRRQISFLGRRGGVLGEETRPECGVHRCFILVVGVAMSATPKVVVWFWRGLGCVEKSARVGETCLHAR